MSHLIEAATQLQIQQVLAYRNASLALVNVARQGVAMLDSVQTPQVVQDGLAPLSEVFGTPRDVAAYISDSMRAWTQAANDVSTEIADLFVSAEAA